MSGLFVFRQFPWYPAVSVWTKKYLKRRTGLDPNVTNPTGRYKFGHSCRRKALFLGAISF